jgi:hypothetical protein
MVRKGVGLLAASAFAAVLGVAVLWAQASLGTAQAFAVLGGTIHTADAVAAQAQVDVTTQYNALVAAPCTSNLTGQDLGGQILTPGVYCFDTSAQLTGPLILDAQGNFGATFIFQIGSTLTTASGARAQVINGGNSCNVFWQIGSSATLGTATSFVGNIVALTSITMTTGATIAGGRLLARNGAVTLDSNTVSFSSCAAPVPALPGWGIYVLGSFLALAGWATLRRRQNLTVRPAGL